jgi:ATP-dependent DNA helicase RecQ
MRWQALLDREAERPPDLVEAQNQMLRQMQRICTGAVCRHKALCEYFGQAYEREGCGACDVCLGEVEGVEDATVLAQKVISCVARVNERFGVGHVVDVLRGADTAQVRRCGHHQLSTFGLLRDWSRRELLAMVYQLVDQGLLHRTDGDRPCLQLNEASWSVLRQQRRVQLLRPRAAGPAVAEVERDAWAGVDRALCEHLRERRRVWATERGVPPYVVFEDSTLRELARARPTTLDGLAAIRGIGEKRLAEFGGPLLDAIGRFCAMHGLATDQAPAEPIARRHRNRANSRNDLATELFARGQGIEQVMAATERARSTVCAYLAQWIEREVPAQIGTWVDGGTYQRVVAAMAVVDEPRLRALYEHLGGAVDYNEIRLVAAHRRALRRGRRPSDATPQE